MSAFSSLTISLGPSATSSSAPGHSNGVSGQAAVFTIFTANSNGQLKSLLATLASDPFPVNVKLTVTFQSGSIQSTIDAPYNVDALNFTTVALHLEDIVGYLSETGWNTEAIEDSYNVNGAEPERRYAIFLGGLIETAQIMKKCKKMGGPGKSIVRGNLTVIVPAPVPAVDPPDASTNSCATIPATTLPDFSVPVAAAVPAPVVPAVTPADRESDGTLLFGGGPKDD